MGAESQEAMPNADFGVIPDSSVGSQSDALVSEGPGNSEIGGPSQPSGEARPCDSPPLGLAGDTGRALQSDEPPLFEADTGRLCLSRSLEFASTRISFPCFLLVPLLLEESDSAPEDLPVPL